MNGLQLGQYDVVVNDDCCVAVLNSLNTSKTGNS